MLEENHRDFMFMHGSMHQLQLHIREPHIDHSLPSRQAFQQHADWPRGRPFYLEGATNEEEVSEESEKDEDMSDED